MKYIYSCFISNKVMEFKFAYDSFIVSPERMFVETHTCTCSDPNSVCPSVKVSVNLIQIAPVRTGSLQL